MTVISVDMLENMKNETQLVYIEYVIPPVSPSLPAFKNKHSEFYLASSTFKCAITEVMNYRKIKKYTNENNNTANTNYN